MKIAFKSLGCPKNQVDLEKILGMLAGQADIVQDPQDADVTIINTCAFIEPAKQESIDTILEIAELKKENPDHKIWVTGCMPQRYKEALANEIPEIDYSSTSTNAEETAQQLLTRLDASPGQSGRYSISPEHYAYMKISQGCTNRCSYCAIPLIKGNHKSFAKADLLDQAEALANQGVQELLIVGQDTTHYGSDLVPKSSLAELLRDLDQKKLFPWIRLLYTHPARWNDELMQVIAESQSIVKYLDIPFQHISDRILKSMGRRVTRHDITSLIKRIRATIPGVAIRTSFIVGYPDESETEFQELYNFIEEIEFERLGVFTYSPEEGTRAERLDDNISEKQKMERMEAIMLLQGEISDSKNSKLLGKHVDVLIDDYDISENTSTGRTLWDAPEIDNNVILKESKLGIGSFHTVEITETDIYDLYGKPVQHQS